MKFKRYPLVMDRVDEVCWWFIAIGAVANVILLVDLVVLLQQGGGTDV